MKISNGLQNLQNCTQKTNRSVNINVLDLSDYKYSLLILSEFQIEQCLYNLYRSKCEFN